MPIRVEQVEEWMPAALALPSSEFKAKVPRWAFHDEARKVANFHAKRWSDFVWAGHTLPGLSSGVKKGSLLSAKTGDEICSLELGAHELQQRYLATFDLAEPSPAVRGDELWREIRAALVYYFDDGIEDAHDVQLAKIDAAHAETPATFGGIALRLDDYGRYAQRHVDGLKGLGGFDPHDIDEAITLATRLRDRPNEPLAMADETRAARDLRDRFRILLDQRVEAVRSAARFVYRDHPDVVRQVTSRYLRSQRAAHRAASKGKAKAAAVDE